jgi:hypothetical protein
LPAGTPFKINGLGAESQWGAPGFFAGDPLPIPARLENKKNYQQDNKHIPLFTAL